MIWRTLMTSWILYFRGARLARLADFLGHVVVGDRFDRRPSSVVAESWSCSWSPVGVVVVHRCRHRSPAASVLGGRLAGRLVDRCRRRQALGLVGIGAFRRRCSLEVDGVHARDRRRSGRGGGVLARPRRRTAPRCDRDGFAAFLFLFLRLGKGAFLRQQRLAVGDRDLVVVRVDFREGEEAVPVAAVVDEGRLQRGFDPRYLCEVDVAGELPLVLGFKVEFLDLVSVHHHDAGLFRVGGVDEHLLCHVPQSRTGAAVPVGPAAAGCICLGAMTGYGAWRGCKRPLHHVLDSYPASSRFAPAAGHARSPFVARCGAWWRRPGRSSAISGRYRMSRRRGPCPSASKQRIPLAA